MFGTKAKVTDEAYLKTYRDYPCAASDDGVNICGRDSVGCHIRTGEVSGIGTKPGHDLTEGLCHEHHMAQESQPGPEFWIERVYKPQRRRAYREWKMTNQTTGVRE